MAVHPVRTVFITTPSPQKPVLQSVIDLLVKNMVLVLPTDADLASRTLPDTTAVYIESEASFYCYDQNDTTSAADGHFILLDGTPTTPRRYKLQGFTTNINFIAGAGTAAVVWTNMPVALNFWQATATRSIQKINLTPYRFVRLHVLMTVVGAATAMLMLRYLPVATGYSTTVTDYLQLGTSEAQVSIAALGFTSSAWIPLAVGANIDAFLALVGINGDGVLDPAFAQIWAEFSS
jgi:hypothetical protein